MGESLTLAMGCGWGGLAGGVFGTGFRFGVLGCLVDRDGRVSVNGWGEWVSVQWVSVVRERVFACVCGW